MRRPNIRALDGYGMKKKSAGGVYCISAQENRFREALEDSSQLATGVKI